MTELQGATHTAAAATEQSLFTSLNRFSSSCQVDSVHFYNKFHRVRCQLTDSQYNFPLKLSKHFSFPTFGQIIIILQVQVFC